ncbi:MAG: HlyC/CorC family transporter [Beduini sp.]|uniref:HlyC/CorC family transporter n=2 Tax=Beduini sp. TaxID=1922300 RepID=UPI0011CCB55C
MDPEQSMQIVIFIVCLVLSAFFSASESALLSVNKIRMRTLAEDGDKRAKTVEKLLSNTNALLSTILVGNNLVNILATSLTTSIAIAIFGNSGIGIATAVVTILILIFSEITPKSLSTKYADPFSLRIGKIITWLIVLFKPVVIILNFISGMIIKLFGGNIEEAPAITEEDLKTFVTVGHEAGVLETEEKEMIHNVFEFGDTEIREIMTPRINVISVAEDVTYDELIETYKKEQFSRILVHSQSFDEILGVLNMKDLLFIDFDKEDFSIKDYMREAYMVYEFNHISDVFAAMRKERVSLAVVLDEYGVMSGLVTFEDIVEEIVGNIDDEYDEEEELIKQIDDKSYYVDGAMSFNEINDEIGTHFESEEFESIGGMVLGACNGAPELHHQLVIDDVLIEVEKIHKNRISLLKLTIMDPIEETGEEE